ncbi:MAG TPA: SMI1/KNR4 family protein, partial [Gemmataceae bacterium]|nr:SMI1/KNR4 family protein [Gemmataceae bacterium]
MELRSEIKKLVDEYVEAKREYFRLRFDKEYTVRLGKPCSPEQIAALEEILGKALPPSYRTFLELHNGFERFIGNQKLLGVEDQEADWVQVEVERIADLFEENGGDNPFERGAIPVEIGQDAPIYMILDPRKVRKDGEMDFVEYDLTEEQNRFKDFVSFLRSKLESTRRLIEKEKKGATEDE